MRRLLALLLLFAGTASGADLSFDVGGERVTSGTLVLVPLGEARTVRPVLEGADKRGPFQRGALQQKSQTVVEWNADPLDYLQPTSDGVIWRSGTTEGRASVLSATWKRSSEAPGWADETSAACQVIFLGGIAYDRTGDGILNGVNIGVYPNENADDAPAIVRDNAALYRPPDEFFRIDDVTAAGRLPLGMTLGELHPASFPADGAVRYVALSPRLLQWIAKYRNLLKEKGLDPDRLRVLRGFVSPTDRQRLDRAGVRLSAFSRFLYGDAVALVYRSSDPKAIDYQSDVTGDGVIDTADIEVLGDIAKKAMDELQMFGGLGICSDYPGPGLAQGSPYLHVDLRGIYSPFRE